MNNSPNEATAPPNSLVESLLPGAYFHDAWSIAAAEPSLDAFEQFLRVAQKTPRWVERLMAIRNQVVSTLGLKNLGGLSQIDSKKPKSQYVTGDRVGIFTLISNSTNEVLLGDNDRHLNVVVSVHKKADELSGAAVITVTTVVHVHNWFGKLYMIPVAPAHRIIARAMVRSIGNTA
jgi:hypothetical protein